MLRLRVSSAISDPTVSFLFPFAGRSLSFLVTLSIFTNMGESLIGSSSVYSRSLSTMTNDMSPLILYSVLPIYNILQTKYRLLQTANCFLFLFFFFIFIGSVGVCKYSILTFSSAVLHIRVIVCAHSTMLCGLTQLRTTLFLFHGYTLSLCVCVSVQLLQTHTHTQLSLALSLNMVSLVSTWKCSPCMRRGLCLSEFVITP